MSDRALVPMLRLDLMSLGNSVRSWVPFLVIVAVVSALAGTELALPMAAAGGFVNATALFAADETYRLRQLYGGLPCLVRPSWSATTWPRHCSEQRSWPTGC